MTPEIRADLVQRYAPSNMPMPVPGYSHPVPGPSILRVLLAAPRPLSAREVWTVLGDRIPLWTVRAALASGTTHGRYLRPSRGLYTAVRP